jgi:thioredoxin reductase (NADPH)
MAHVAPAFDDRGHVLAGRDLLEVEGRSRWQLDRDPLYLETSQPGVFVAGDRRHGSIKRVASAVGEGAMAASLVHSFLDGNEH